MRAAAAIVVALLALPRVAAADERVECAHAYEQTQRVRQKGESLAALAEAQRCARATCPEILRRDCVQWAGEIESKLARVVARVRGADGCFRNDPILDVSGSHRMVEGGGVLMDPGVHELRVVDPASGATKTETIEFGAGERRDLDFDFAAPGVACHEQGTATAEKPARKVPTSAWIVGGIGGGLLVTGLGLGVVGAVKRGDLDDCKPNCSSDRIDGVRPFFVAGDVIGGIGLLALGAGVAIYLLSSPSATTGLAPFTWAARP